MIYCSNGRARISGKAASLRQVSYYFIARQKVASFHLIFLNLEYAYKHVGV